MAQDRRLTKIFFTGVTLLLSAAVPALSQPALNLPDDEDGFGERLRQENGAKSSRFAILAHKPNYFLPLSYVPSQKNHAYDSFAGRAGELDNLEVKFQLSFKIPLYEDLFGGKADIYAAYTQLALWQAYNAKISAPFREINYEPEAFISYRTDIRAYGFKLKSLSFGINHQSNGQIEPISRSWNRLVGGVAVQKGKNYFFLRQWVRMPEKANGNDNPGMGKYMGYGDLLWTRNSRSNSLSILLRNNLRSDDNKGALQVEWGFPLHRKLKGYAQFFTGYGESLISYNRPVTRIGLGVALTDWI